MTRKKARATAGDLTSNGEIPDASSADLAGEATQYITQLERQLKGARTTHKDVGGDFHGDFMAANRRASWLPSPPASAQETSAF